MSVHVEVVIVIVILRHVRRIATLYSSSWKIGGDGKGRSTGPSENPRLRATNYTWATKWAWSTKHCLAVHSAGLASWVVEAHEHVERLLETLENLLVAARVNRTTILAILIHIWRSKETMRHEVIGVAYVGLVWVRMIVTVVVSMIVWVWMLKVGLNISRIVFWSDL